MGNPAAQQAFRKECMRAFLPVFVSATREMGAAWEWAADEGRAIDANPRLTQLALAALGRWLALRERPRDRRRRPVFLHSVGRCGSTLLAQALAALPGVCALSEPGIYSAVQSAVEAGALDGPVAIGLLRAATASLAASVARADTLVVKTRSEDCRAAGCAGRSGVFAGPRPKAEPRRGPTRRRLRRRGTPDPVRPS